MALSKIFQLVFLVGPLFVGSATSAQPDDPPEAFTYFRTGEDVHWAESAPRVALLIGNDDYESAPPVEGHSEILTLRSLKRACADVKQIAKQLHGLGWAKSEVALLCNQNQKDIVHALDILSDVPRSNSSAPPLIFIYMSGHGTQVGKHSYFFGINARPDYDKSAADYVALPERRLFPNEAVDVLDHLIGSWGPSLRWPVVLILDDCRDNPLKPSISKALDNALEKYLANGKQGVMPLLGAPSGVEGPPDGMLLGYATKSGHTVEDGPDGSRLSSAVVQEMLSGRDVGIVLKKAASFIEEKNLDWPDNQRQSPDILDRIFIDKNNQRPCFAGCVAQQTRTNPDQFPARLPIGAGTSKSTRFTSLRYLAGDDNSIPDSTASRTDEVARRASVRGNLSVFTQEIPDEIESFNLEVFWCGGANEQVNYDAAFQFSSGLKARLVNDPKSDAAARVRSVRLTGLTESLNARPGFQHDGKSVVIGEHNRLQRNVAISVLGGSSRGFRVIRNRDGTDGYIAVYFCVGSYSGPKAPVVYVQVPRIQQLGVGNRLIAAISESMKDVNVSRSAVVPPVPSPSLTQVRYFSESRRAFAIELADEVKSLLKLSDVIVVPATWYKGSDKDDQVQVWLGSSDYDLSVTDLPRGIP